MPYDKGKPRAQAIAIMLSKKGKGKKFPPKSRSPYAKLIPK